MVKENLIPKTETVYELKNEIPSYEEFMKTYERDEAIEIITEAEYGDRVLYGSQYGPGNEKSTQAGLGVGIGAGLLVTSAVCPPLGVAMTTSFAVGGLTTKVVGSLSNLPELEKAGDVIGLGATIGGLGGGFIGSAGHGCVACKTPSGGNIWKI